MTRADYRAEARAWRASARLTDAWRNTLREGYGPPTILMTRRDAMAGLAHPMWTRWLAWTRGSASESLTKDREASVWFCLLLALEAEDDARRAE